jgi:uncharacterized membrane protein
MRADFSGDSIMAISVTLHILAAVIWVGGMFFAYMALRPAIVETLQPPFRLQLWVSTFKRFFLWVWLSVLAILASGYWMVFSIFGGFAQTGVHIDIMHIGGLVMVLIYMHVFFVPYRRMRHAVTTEDFATAAANLGQIRKLVGLNLLLGLAVISVASAGRYLSF